MRGLGNFAVLFILIVQVPPLSADDYKWDLVNALTRGEPQRAEQILGDHIAGMSAGEKRLVYSFALVYTRGENTLKMLELLFTHNIHAVQYDLYSAVNYGHADQTVDFIIRDGARPNGEILLLASEKQRWNLVRKFTEMGADLNYQYPPGKPYADGMTALIHAAKNKNLEMIQFLVEHGANVNLRAINGSTAASIAYENGEMEIYNYLKEKGAVDFTPAPPRERDGQGLSGLIWNGASASSFRTGTYRLSGSTTEIKLTGAGNSGRLNYTNSVGTAGSGVFQISGNTITITTEGRIFTFRIDTNSSFSGNGETWIRTGD
jgi:hypothetical protein